MGLPIFLFSSTRFLFIYIHLELLCLPDWSYLFIIMECFFPIPGNFIWLQVYCCAFSTTVCHLYTFSPSMFYTKWKSHTRVHFFERIWKGNPWKLLFLVTYTLYDYRWFCFLLFFLVFSDFSYKNTYYINMKRPLKKENRQTKKSVQKWSQLSSVGTAWKANSLRIDTSTLCPHLYGCVRLYTDGSEMLLPNQCFLSWSLF